MPHEVIVFVQDDHLAAWNIHDLNRKGMQVGPWQAWRMTTVVHRVVGLLDWYSPLAEGRLGFLVLCLTPWRHWRFGGLECVQVVRARFGADDAAPHTRQIWGSLGKSGCRNCEGQQQRKGETNPGQHEFSG